MLPNHVVMRFSLILVVSALAYPQQKPTVDKPKLEYMGTVVCQGCHEEIYNAFVKSPHYLVETDKKRGFEGQACESCHGMGSLHAETAEPKNIRNPLRLPVAEANRTCLQCHMNQPTRVGAIRGGHARNQVACNSCHSVHKPKPRKIVTNCGTCHVAQLAQFQRPFRHKLQEGGIDCVDCHNPHGRLLTNQLKDVSANEPGCFKCHSDKRGPFSFEHAPMRTDGCQACHEAHGSANPRMLTRHEVRLVCLECHANLGSNLPTVGGVPPSLHDLRLPTFRNCTVCHVKVHGSHINRTLLR
ncbi:MAG: DmsE family decaheme c-type cytochrome [Candidatus Solibacter usitatus]|nr:DmsE family decaheme c-type cytochrome [Candidatus Solibacter usitatus]